MKKKYIKSADLMNILSVSKETLIEWRKSGDFPIHGKRGKSYIFDPQRVIDWLINGNKLEYAEKLMQYQENLDSLEYLQSEKMAAKLESIGKSMNIEVDVEFEEMLREIIHEVDIFKAKEILGKLLLKAASRLSQASGMKVAFETRNFSKLTTELRQLEMSCIEVDKALKKIVMINEAQKWLGIIFTKVKTDLRSLPFAVADEIASLVVTDKKAEIAAIIKRKVDDGLRHLNREFLK
jgi:hypothetical protein